MSSFAAGRRLLAWLVALVLAPSAGLGATLPDYAYRAELSAAGEGLYRVDPGSDILVDLARADGGDIAVFNADGQRLPQRLDRPSDRVEARQADLEIHRFEAFERRGERRITRRELRRDRDGLAELSATEALPVVAATQRYLVDLRLDGEPRRFERLDLEWRQRPAGQWLELTLEAGDELGRMRRLAQPAVISNQPGGDVAWRSLADIGGDYRYLSLQPAAAIDHFELQRVVGHYRVTEAAPRAALDVTAEVREADGQRFHVITLPWALRPQALAIRPAETNRLLVAEIFTSRGDEPRRLARTQVRQHSFDAARAAPADPVELPRGGYDRLWIRFAEEPARSPRLQLLFAPKRLTFLGDGRAPYTLAWGNYQAGAPGDDLGALFGAATSARLAEASHAAIGARGVAGGPARLAPRPPLPWKKWLLWALLIGAALLTARMALRLYREINAGAAPPGEN